DASGPVWLSRTPAPAGLLDPDAHASPLTQLCGVLDGDRDVRPEPHQHLGKAIRGEFREVAGHQPRHLRRGVVHDDSGLVTRQAESIDLALRLAAEKRAWDTVFLEGGAFLLHALGGGLR